VNNAARYARRKLQPLTPHHEEEAMTDQERQSKVTLPVNKEPVLRVVPMPANANQSGDIFGGWIMSQVDVAGSIPAVRAAKGRVATVAVNSFQFKQPVFIGDVVSFYAEVERVGRTSITVNVEVYAQRNPVHPECVKVTEATLTYVAVDAGRRPRIVGAQQ
jgi:acyl-CoA thioesterase YciA